jgi:hypothetical protein
MQWLKGHKKEILKSLLLVLIVGAMAGCGYGILRLCGFSSQEDFIRLRDDLGDSIWFWLVIAALQIFQVIFIPVSNQLVTVPCALCFQDELWKVFFDIVAFHLVRNDDSLGYRQVRWKKSTRLDIR